MASAATDSLVDQRVSVSQEPIYLTPSMLPNNPNETFRESTFFKSNPNLPSPEEVRAQSRAHNVTFESMGPLVKWGPRFKIEEGQCLYAIRRDLRETVPVPEIYGWRTDGQDVFLYMELIDGQPLSKVWDSTDKEDLIRLCGELQVTLSNLRRLRQDPMDPFVGDIGRGGLYDRAIASHSLSDSGPFSSVKDFHDW
ncbi:hypothetical protein AJ79_07574 [Helicocarpus griseus UAMH5409]|uniref:Aminoglycoside phosphotransferase domain-containing protein n=1 Tax=Helicocarpus griseus UAMH5409 TaxID=1447875 RepID=A0A2B7X188_9EURO|nr:hypothetical protein AJ79_07574 [Helicocarpus griseus UAMH5409]